MEMLVFLFMVYVVFSLSTIKYRLDRLELMAKRLNIDEEEQPMSDEEIEKELEDYLDR